MQRRITQHYVLAIAFALILFSSCAKDFVSNGEEAKLKMREHFVTKIEGYKLSNNYESLGYALHMVQDIYSPAHSLKDWDGSVISYIPHVFEGRVFNRHKFNDALDATINIFEQISQCESNDESIGRVFDDFLRNFESQYVE